ncbi:hypothetical protein CHELA20_52125 [Hyphomicrobiales bacterium]|nr:hypothetical protein CHELA41_22795 [Hyphomicrobiales bacterium]CAH1680746.1 hypothetical protein CHELA20_52125 [Hyphomicrobiales bacterium]
MGSTAESRDQHNNCMIKKQTYIQATPVRFASRLETYLRGARFALSIAHYLQVAAPPRLSVLNIPERRWMTSD